MEILVGRGYFWGVLRRISLTVLMFVLCPSVGALSPAAPTVTVYYSDRPPFCVVDGQTGFLIDAAKAILADAGVRARFIELPVNRIRALLWSGPTDAMALGWVKTPSREAFGRYSQPIYQELPLVAVVNARVAKGLPNPVRIDQLLGSGLTLGAKAGTSAHPVLDQKIRAQGLVPVETSGTVVELLGLVQEGRMDYTFLAGEEASYDLETNPGLVPNLVVVRLVDPPPGNLRCFYYPSSLDPTLAERIDGAIERLHALETTTTR